MEEESDNHRHSPFFHIRNYIKLFSIFLGLPLTPVSKNYDEFKFLTVTESIKIVILVGSCLVLHIVPVWILYISIDYNYLSGYYKAFGVSKLDIFVAFSEYQSCLIISIVFFFYFFAKCTEKLNVLLASMKKLNYELETCGCTMDYVALKQQPRKIVFCSHLGRFANTCFATVMYFVFSKGYNLNGKQYTLVSNDGYTAIKLLPLLISNCIVTNSPFFSSTEFVVYYISNHLRKNVQMISTLVSKIGHESEEKRRNDTMVTIVNTQHNNSLEEDYDSNQKMQFSRTLDMPFKGLKVVSSFNETFSGIVLTVYVSTLGLITVSSYGLASIVLSFPRLNNQEAVTFAYLRGCWCFLIAAGNIHKILRLTQCSNSLQKSLIGLKNNLNDILYVSLNSVPSKPKQKEFESYRQKIWIFKQELQLINSPLSPFSAFDVSNRTLISAFATLITYLIVLIQFKISEFDNDLNLKNSNCTIS